MPGRTVSENSAMVSAAAARASRADAAVLVIAANEGVREQSRRHAYLLSLLGIKQLVVVVNKMDLADFEQKKFAEIEREYRKFLKELGLEARMFVPAWNRLRAARFHDQRISRRSWSLLQRSGAKRMGGRVYRRQ